MKNKIKFILFLLCCSLVTTLNSQSLVFAWNGKFEAGLNIGPSFFLGDLGGMKKIEFKVVDNSLIVVPDSKDSLSILKIVYYDSTSVQIESITLKPKKKKYSISYLYLNISDSLGIKLMAKFRKENWDRPVELIYSFETECCSNHKPSHCADSPASLKKLKDSGCTGFARPTPRSP